MQGQKRLTGNTPILMVFLAVVIDLAQIILDFILIGLVVNRLIDILVLILYFVWFRANKVSFTKMRALIFFGLGFVEFLPALDAFPLWTIDIIAVIITVKMEDRLGINAETIISDPRLGRILKKGIIKGVNTAGNRSALIKNTLEGAGWPQNTNNQRNIDNTPMPNNSRDAKIKEQQNRKSNANE